MLNADMNLCDLARAAMQDSNVFNWIAGSQALIVLGTRSCLIVPCMLKLVSTRQQCTMES